MSYVVDNTVDEQLLLQAGVPQNQIQYLGSNTRAGTGDYSTPSDLQSFGGGSAIYVGHAAQAAPDGSLTLAGDTRTGTSSAIGNYLSETGGPAPTAFGADQQSALDVLDQQLSAWGLDGLEATAKNLLTQGLSSDAVMVQLENSDAFKTRFAGNQMRIQNGLPVLSPADYVATEASYDQVLRQYGINDQFSTRDNYAKWIGGNVSSTELQTRAQEADSLVQESDPTARNLLSQWYGIGNNDLIATFLDPDTAQNALDKKAYAANVGAAMQRYGLGANQQSAEGLYGAVTQDQATAGLQAAGQTFGQTQELAQRYGASYTANDAINQYVLGEEAPALIQQQLAQKEQAQFSRGSGFSTQGTGVSSGSF